MLGPTFVHHLELYQAEYLVPRKPALPPTLPMPPLCPACPWNWGKLHGCSEFLVCPWGQGLGLELPQLGGGSPCTHGRDGFIGRALPALIIWHMGHVPTALPGLVLPSQG